MIDRRIVIYGYDTILDMSIYRYQNIIHYGHYGNNVRRMSCMRTIRILSYYHIIILFLMKKNSVKSVPRHCRVRTVIDDVLKLNSIIE